MSGLGPTLAVLEKGRRGQAREQSAAFILSLEWCMLVSNSASLVCENALGAWDIVSASLCNGHAYRQSESLECRFGTKSARYETGYLHVMVVLPTDKVNVQSDSGLERKRLEKVRDHLGRHWVSCAQQVTYSLPAFLS